MVDTLVETRYGKVLGTGEKDSVVWKGIPYAKPPVNSLRFQPPQPLEVWDGVKETTDFGPICPQNEEAAAMIGTPIHNISEDCLYLNIWTPKTDSEKRPVMVWIHGGAFNSGTGSSPLYNGANLAQNGDVVVVTINYRLGAFGFLHLAGVDEHFTANLGLLDQIAALKWVKENIESFGGDSDQVTIFGESAGSMSIASLLTMPEAKGLFQKAIMESGASQVMTSKGATAIARAMLKQLNVEENDIEALQNISVRSILEATDQVQKLYGSTSPMIFQPTIDNKTLPDYPIEAIKKGQAEGIALLIGTNREEGAFFFRKGTKPVPKEVMDKTITTWVGEQLAQKVIAYYPHTIEGQAELMTDFVFWFPSIEFATTQSYFAPVWMYRFDWHIPENPYVNQTVHGLEIPFVFNNLEYLNKYDVVVDQNIQDLAKQIQSSWIAFVREENPNSRLLPFEWPNYNASNKATAIFENESHIENGPNDEKFNMFFATQR